MEFHTQLTDKFMFEVDVKFVMNKGEKEEGVIFLFVFNQWDSCDFSNKFKIFTMIGKNIYNTFSQS